MALYTCNAISLVLKTSVTYNVILPPSYRGDALGQPLEDCYPQETFKTLYLLHGGVADASCWIRYTSIERYAEEKHIAVVMPSVGNSYYTDMAHGLKYYTFVTEELPMMARAAFPLSSKREDNFVAGLSMGGYGALKIALNHPDRYAACASISGVVDIVDLLYCGLYDDLLALDDIFGDRSAVKGSSNDIYALTDRLAGASKPFPGIYLAVGSSDYFCKTNLEYHEHLNRLGINHTFDNHPGGHDWLFWDPHLENAIRWLP